MAKKGGSAPKAPDPYETAAAQTQANLSTAIANTAMGMVNRNTPDGSLSYEVTGQHQYFDPTTGRMTSVPTYTATETLSEDQQRIRDANNEAEFNLATLAGEQSKRVGDLLRDPFSLDDISPAADRSGIEMPNYNQLPGTPEYSTGADRTDLEAMQIGYEDDFSGARQQVIDALNADIDQGRSRDMERLEANLANRGIGIGTEQYTRAMEDFQSSTDEARLAAILAGGQEHSRLAGLARDEASFRNSSLLSRYDRDEAARSYDDAIAGQEFQDALTLSGIEDNRADTRFAQENYMADQSDAARTRELEEAFAERNQPLNEIMAILSGTQVSAPGFSVATPYAAPTTDIANLINTNHAQKMEKYALDQQQRQALMGGLFNLGSAAILA